jgi:hypothetical protein
MVVQRAIADQVQPAWRLEQNREEWEESTSLQVFPSHPRPRRSGSSRQILHSIELPLADDIPQ